VGVSKKVSTIVTLVYGAEFRSGRTLAYALSGEEKLNSKYAESSSSGDDRVLGSARLAFGSRQNT
jgi:hypothetical protein